MKSMGRRGFLAAATALGAGAGLSAYAAVSAADGNKTPDKTPDIASRDRDLPFIGTEETFSTPTLLKLNSINQDHIALLLKYISVDRVMFATDYPFADIKEQTDWFRGVDLPREAKEKIAFRNAEKLFRIKVPVK
ncbi:amidohydrolase family protein [Actinomadura sp. B10D3]|uniref:amidohydrolase family protein n=1 Tax=Actinomadura sp. B10D3 TaxID=3153557 RepID=UPI00325F2968